MNFEFSDNYKYTSGRKLSEVVNYNFRTVSVFEKYGLDFCCNGSRSIRQACEEKKLDVKSILKELTELKPEPISERYTEWRLDFLIDYIINNHHRFVQKKIPHIISLQDKITRELKAMENVSEVIRRFGIIYKDLRQHMIKEEQILFPYIKQLVQLQDSGLKGEPPFFGSVRNPVSMMESEHKSTGEEFERIDDIIRSYYASEKELNLIGIYFKEIRLFEIDLHKHIHLENNILFPKSIALEKEML